MSEWRCAHRKFLRAGEEEKEQGWEMQRLSKQEEQEESLGIFVWNSGKEKSH